MVNALSLLQMSDMEISQRLGGGAARRSFSLNRLRLAIAAIGDHAVVGMSCAALLGVSAWIGHYTSFYSIDGDVKYLGADSLARHFPSAAIPYPGRTFDPAGRYILPLTAWFGGHQYAGYSLLFLAIAASAIKLFGAAGVIVPPVLGTGVLLYGQFRLADLLGLRTNRVILAGATVAATPVLFYSVSFWEHTWGAGLLLAGFAVLLTVIYRQVSRWPLYAAGAGLLLSAAVMMRRDTAIPAVVFLVLTAVLCRRRQAWTAILLAGAMMVLPLACIVLLHPEPLALGITHASPGRGAIGIRKSLTRLDRFEFLFDGGWATLLLAGVLIGATIAAMRRSRVVMPIVVIGGFVAGVALTAKMLDPYLVSNQNLFAFCPLALWGLCLPLMWRYPNRSSISTRSLLAFVEAHSLEVLLWGLALLGPVAVVLMEYDSGGAQWGPRYLLFAFPLLVLLALSMRQRLNDAGGKRLVNYGFVGMLGFSILLQCAGLMALTIQKDLSSRAAAAVARTHVGTVVSASPIIDVLAPSYRSHRYLYAPTQGQLVTLMGRLHSTGTERTVVMCEPLSHCHWNAYPGWEHGPERIVSHKVGIAVYSRG